MTALSIIINIVLILISIVLIVIVLMQQGQRQGLGAIGGGAETFFGKNKARSLDGKLQKITKIAAAAFIVLAIVSTIVTSHNLSDQPSTRDLLNELQQDINDAAASSAEPAETADADATAEPAEDDAADAPEATDTIEATDAPEATDPAVENTVDPSEEPAA